MIITKELLQKELQGLRQQRIEAQSQLDAVIGAIQLMEQLINLANQPEEKLEEKTDDR